MPTTTLIITGMQSDDCLRTVMNALQDLPCIGYVDVSMATGEATIEQVGWEIFRLILDIASGRKKTWADQWGLFNALAVFNPAPVT